MASETVYMIEYKPHHRTTLGPVWTTTSSLVTAEMAMRHGHRVIEVNTTKDEVAANELALPYE